MHFDENDSDCITIVAQGMKQEYNIMAIISRAFIAIKAYCSMIENLLICAVLAVKCLS